MDEDQQFCLRWNNHQSTLISVFDTLLEKGTLVDCTLAAEGQFLKAHKVVLSACSPYFAALLSQQYDKHPIFILKDVKFQELRAMMDYMYRGEVNISQDQLAALLKAAESLQIKGLSDSSGGRNNGTQSSHSKDTTAANKNASSKSSGLTIEQKMPRLAGAAATEGDADLSEGSASPNARKRKKVRRRSVDTNNVDNHDHSNSSSHSMPHGGAAATQQQSQPQQQTASTMPTNITSATSSANVLSVTKKTDQEMRTDVEMNETDDQQQRPAKEVQRQNNGGRKSISSSAATPGGKATTGSVTKDGQDLIEPKNEYDESNEETVEDLTLDEEEMMEELDQAGPSHGGEGSSQGYPQWPVDRSQDNEAFMSGQDAAGHHRDTQDDASCSGIRMSMEEEDSFTVYEVIEEPLILENENIAVTLDEDKIKLLNWNELKTQNLTSIDWIKKGEVDIIRCAKVKTKRPREIPVGGVFTMPTISTSTTIGNNGVAKKTTKNHPRIKYSVKHPPVAGQATAQSMASLVSSISGVHSNQKAELLNFTLSRKFGRAMPTSFFETEQTKVGHVLVAPNTTQKIVQPVTQIYIQQPLEPKPVESHITTEEIMGDLSNYEIDEIEMPPYSSEGGAESIDKDSQSSFYREDSKFDDSEDVKYLMNESATDDGTKNFECRHCGKKYRWKSTLRRHENVECGGKEPAHQCPHCNYKAKQRGNLGVHIRKHHGDMPQLETRRKNRSI